MVDLRVLGRADGPALAALHAACPIDAGVRFAFDRGDDSFAWPDAVFDRYRYVGAFDGGTLVGSGLLGGRDGWTGEAVRPWFYAGDARVHPDHRGRGIIASIAAALEADLWAEVDHGVGIVKRGNRAGERFAASLARSGRFSLYDDGRLLVALIPVLRGWRGDPAVAVESSPDPGEVAAVLAGSARRGLARPLDAAGVVAWAARPGVRWWLARRHGRPVGALATWEMRAVRGRRVLRYSPAGAALRAVTRAIALLRPGVAALPPAGGALVSWTATSVVAPEPGVLRALLGAAAAAALGQGVHLLECAFRAGEPGVEALRGIPCQWFDSQVYGAVRRGRSPIPGPLSIDGAWI